MYIRNINMGRFLAYNKDLESNFEIRTEVQLQFYNGLNLIYEIKDSNSG